MADREVPPSMPTHVGPLAATGYGAVCGLIFPLMISSTFLQQIGLSHGAGNAFGLMFFCAYTAAMVVYAVVGKLAGGSGRPWELPVGLALAFLGNCLMVARQLGVLEGGWLHTGAMAVTIGCGLAMAELGWLRRLARLGAGAHGGTLRVVSLSYLVGCLVATCIFAAADIVELSFAPVIILVSAPLAVRLRALDGARPQGGEPACEAAGAAGAARAAGGSVFAKAIVYLVVVSFVFGALSQASAVMPHPGFSVKVLALAGIALASVAMFAASLRRSGRAPGVDLYWVLFPVVACALVALPFIDMPAFRVAATVLVFTAFYLTGINTRVVLCRLAGGDRGRAGLLASAALGSGSLAILLGVAFGANVLAVEDPMMGLATVALASLFVLALSPLPLRAVERHAAASGDGAGSPDVEGERAQEGIGAAARAEEERRRRMEGYARACGMTAREAEVLAMLCSGRTRTYIAAELGLSPNTVKGYIHAIYQKAGALDKQDLIDRVERAVQGD